jgi:DNA polymerase-3 subunit alpha
MTIVPLHNHSEFSLLDGWSTATEIAQRCVDIGCPCCGLTDHGVVAGHLDFAKALEKVNVKPIFGCEFYTGSKATGFKAQERDQAHLIALAMTDQGLRNLWSLNSAAARDDHFRFVSRIFREDIAKYKEGIVFTSACALGRVPRGLLKDDYDDLNWYLDTLGDNFYIELSTYPGDKDFNDRDLDGNPVNTRIINEALVNIGLERGCQFVYGDDGHYAFPHQFEQHDIYLARQTGDTIYTPIEDRTMYHPPEAVCIKDEKMVRANLSYLPDSVVQNAIDNAVAIGERASAQLPEVRRHLPVFIPNDCPWVTDEDKQDIEASDAPSDETLFLKLVADGIHRRYGSNPSDEVISRAMYECETLIRDGIHHYFLMGWDEVTFCDRMGISRGPGRGSSAGCIVAYCLGITDVDPLRYGLIFERFWNSGRADGFPDIDSDFARSSRQDVIDYLKYRWGEDKVVDIGTVGRMKPKKVANNLQRVFKIEDGDLADLKKILSEVHDIEIHGHEQIGWSRELEPGKIIYVEDDVGPEIEKWIDGDPVKEDYIDMCRSTCSRVDLYGIHPSGIVVSDVPLADELPAALRGSAADGRRPATQFPMDTVDKRYFVKLDVLGLRTLDTLAHWTDMMHEEGIDINWSGLEAKEHPEAMWDLLSEGFTAGIFQVETQGGRAMLSKISVRSLDDLAIVVALNRPGPNVDQYVAKRNDPSLIVYDHPRLEEILSPILEPTHGEFVYQEQVINYFNSLGYTLHESDAVRKILGKKKPEALEALHDGTGEWEGRGYLTMTEAAGVPKEASQPVWDGLERFASYSFNKSHAVAYATIAFRCLYAKFYAPAQFYAACIRTAEGDKRKEMLPLYVNEARRMKVDVLPPDIRLSRSLACVVNGDKIYLGFSDVKGIGNSGPYMEKCRDEFSDISTPEAFYAEFEKLNSDYLKLKGDRTKLLAKGETVDYEVPEKSPKQLLRANGISAIYQAGAWDSLVPSDLPMDERQKLEEELLEVILTDYTQEAFERNAEVVAKHVDEWELLKTSWSDKVDEDDPEDVSAFVYVVPGVITGIEEKRGKTSGKKYGVITIEYEANELQFVAYNSAWRSHKFMWRMRTPGIFTIKHTPPNEFPEVYSYQLIKAYALQP